MSNSNIMSNTTNTNDLSLTLSLNILKALGGDTSVQYDTVDDIWTAIKEIYGAGSVYSGYNFNVLGYNNTLNDTINSDIQNSINYSVSVKDKLGDKTYASSLFGDDTNLVFAPYFDTSNVTDMSMMFCNCFKLKWVPCYNTSKVTTMYYMFNSCTSLTSVPQFNTSNVTDMEHMFSGCTSLTSIPQFDTSKVTTMNSMFRSCDLLETVPLLDTSNVTNINNIFTFCTSLNDVGGLKNLGMQPSLTTSSAFSSTNNLTHDSIMNIINNLYDRKSAGYSVVTLPFGSSNLAKLTDEEKAIATNKGWTLT